MSLSLFFKCGQGGSIRIMQTNQRPAWPSKPELSGHYQEPNFPAD
jgi:hypothetical protein